jgi:uncharacterized membrane protein (DUF106 family)
MVLKEKKMKDKIIKGIAIATVSLISAALVAYLKDPKNRLAVKKAAKEYQGKAKKAAKKYQAKFQKSARKAKTAANKQLEKRGLEYRI